MSESINTCYRYKKYSVCGGFGTRVNAICDETVMAAP